MTQKNNVLDIKAALNAFSQPPAPYTRLEDLRHDEPYRVLNLERIDTPYGETIMITLEGHFGEDANLRVYLPRRFNEALTDDQIAVYNSDRVKSVALVKRNAPPGCRHAPLEFI